MPATEHQPLTAKTADSATKKPTVHTATHSKNNAKSPTEPLTYKKFIIKLFKERETLTRETILNDLKSIIPKQLTEAQLNSKSKEAFNNIKNSMSSLEQEDFTKFYKTFYADYIIKNKKDEIVVDDRTIAALYLGISLLKNIGEDSKDLLKESGEFKVIADNVFYQEAIRVLMRINFYKDHRINFNFLNELESTSFVTTQNTLLDLFYFFEYAQSREGALKREFPRDKFIKFFNSTGQQSKMTIDHLGEGEVCDFTQSSNVFKLINDTVLTSRTRSPHIYFARFEGKLKKEDFFPVKTEKAKMHFDNVKAQLSSKLVGHLVDNKEKFTCNPAYMYRIQNELEGVFKEFKSRSWSYHEKRLLEGDLFNNRTTTSGIALLGFCLVIGYIAFNLPYVVTLGALLSVGTIGLILSHYILLKDLFGYTGSDNNYMDASNNIINTSLIYTAIFDLSILLLSVCAELLMPGFGLMSFVVISCLSPIVAKVINDNIFVQTFVPEIAHEEAKIETKEVINNVGLSSMFKVQTEHTTDMNRDNLDDTILIHFDPYF